MFNEGSPRFLVFEEFLEEFVERNNSWWEKSKLRKLVVSSSLQDSSQYSGRGSFDGLHSSVNFQPSSPLSNSLVTVPNAPITIGIIVSCMFHSFFNSLARSRYLSLCHQEVNWFCLCTFVCASVDLFNTRWNDKIVLKKTTLQLYFKTFIEKNQFSQLDYVVELTSIQCNRLQPQSPPR